MSKVSDFKIAESILRKICRSHNATFVDVSISFEDDIDGTLFVGNTKNIAHTIFRVVVEYLDLSQSIVGVELMPEKEDRDNFLVVLASNLRNYVYGDDINNYSSDEPHVIRLYQLPMVWLLMKNIICPIYKQDLINLKIVYGNNPEVDIARFCDKAELPSSDISDESFIFVNIIDNRILQKVFIFIEALKAFDLCPIEVIQKIYSTDLYSKFKGLLEIALDDDDVLDFETAIMTNLGINFYSMISHKTAFLNPKLVKIAQNSVPGLPNQFWQLGLLEKMIGPTRGADWEVYKNLEPYVKEFWDKVEEVRKKRIENGHDSGVPFNTLLRIKEKQTVGYEVDPTKTLQSLLSSNRVW